MAKIPRQLHRWRGKISDIIVDGDGAYNVGLRRGWICGLTETHQVYESTFSEVLRVFQAGWVEACRCEECHEVSA